MPTRFTTIILSLIFIFGLVGATWYFKSEKILEVNGQKIGLGQNVIFSGENKKLDLGGMDYNTLNRLVELYNTKQSLLPKILELKNCENNVCYIGDIPKQMFSNLNDILTAEEKMATIGGKTVGELLTTAKSAKIVVNKKEQDAQFVNY